MPVITDDEHAKRKAKYVAKYGYKITIPGLEDIIHVGMPDPMTLAENKRWQKREYDTFTKERFEELQRMKEKKKLQFDNIMRSPSPPVMQNLGSILCALDDAQDCLSTLACIGRLASAIAPRLLGKILAGPIGLVMSASDALNLMNALPQYCLGMKAGKRRMNTLSKASPKKNKAKAKLADRLRKAMPKQGDWIQALQTTDQIFGFGVSLGPLVGLAQDILFGTMRFKEGEYVHIEVPDFDFPEWRRRGSRFFKSAGAWWTVAQNLPAGDALTMIVAQDLSNQLAADLLEESKVLEQIPDLSKVEIKAPVPNDPLTLELIAEQGLELDDVIGWPQTNTKWATVEECQEASMWGAVGTLEDFVRENKHRFEGLMGGFCANMAAMFIIAAWDDTGRPEYKVAPSMHTASTFAENGLAMAPLQPLSKFKDFAGYLHMNDQAGYYPSLKETVDYCKGPANIKLINYGR